MTNTNNIALIWTPRVLMIILIIFFSLLSLDVFNMEAPLLNKIGGFLIQMIPSFCLIALLALSWKKPYWSGIVCIILSVVFTVFFRTYASIYTFLAISVTTAVCGILFLYSNALISKSN